MRPSLTPSLRDHSVRGLFSAVLALTPAGCEAIFPPGPEFPVLSATEGPAGEVTTFADTGQDSTNTTAGDETTTVVSSSVSGSTMDSANTMDSTATDTGTATTDSSSTTINTTTDSTSTMGSTNDTGQKTSDSEGS